ncbi:MAG TPA: hypothetical protein VFC93_18030 [Chloroflexota bacterium]|nr:hypothetical protein [Chloroflexota bacterium]
MSSGPCGRVGTRWTANDEVDVVGLPHRPASRRPSSTNEIGHFTPDEYLSTLVDAGLDTASQPSHAVERGLYAGVMAP